MYTDMLNKKATLHKLHCHYSAENSGSHDVNSLHIDRLYPYWWRLLQLTFNI